MTKISVATQNGGLDDKVSSIFGRCQTFTIVETDEGEIKNSEVIQNKYANERSGAGIQAASLVANSGAEAVIAGNFGPNVASVFSQSGIEMVPASNLSVRDAVNKYLKGEIEPVTQATTPAMSGSGGGRGRGGGRRMLSQQGSGSFSRREVERSSSQTGSGKPGEKIESLENRVNKLENLIEEIKKSIEELKR